MRRSMVVQDVTEPVFCDVGVQTDLPSNQCDEAMQTDLDLRAVENDQQQRLTENIELEDKLSMLSGNGFPSQDVLSKGDQLVNSYTGVSSFDVLNVLFGFIAPVIAVTSSSKLTKFEQFTLVLMKLKMNIPNFDLAFRFGISKSTVSRIIRKWIFALDDRLSRLIYWPTREELIRTMPFCFRPKYKLRLVSIIDCFEILNFIEKPSKVDLCT